MKIISRGKTRSLSLKTNIISFPPVTVENVHRSHHCDHVLGWTPFIGKTVFPDLKSTRYRRRSGHAFI